MELIFGNRYEVRRTVKELRLGMLFEAYDLPLNRNVLLYEIAPERTTTDSREAVKRGAAFTHDRFMHILDVGTEKGMPYAVFKACEGAPLEDELHKHRMRPQQLLGAVYELGKAMQDAAEEGIYGYSVCADNLWLGGGTTLMPIHYWDAADERRRGAAGLCHLIYQLASRTDILPGDADEADNRLRMAFRTLPQDTVEALVALYRRVFREKLSLTAFLLELHAHLQSFAPSGKKRPDPEWRSEHPAPAKIDVPSTPLEAEPSRAERTEAVVASRFDNEPLSEETKRIQAVREAAVHEDKEPEDDGRPAVRTKLWKKFAILAGAACLFVVVFVGGLMLIFQVANRDGTDRTAAVNTTPPASTKAPEPAPKEKAADNPANADTQSAQTADAVPTSIPQLIGLSRADAEKRALDAGLHYTFYIEKNDAAKDTVFKQEPNAGEPAVKGGSVTFWVSKGN
jgi:serine/threonine-protein kinase